MSAGVVFLTGIKPTGIPHLGNIKGAIEPAIRRDEGYLLKKTATEGLAEFCSRTAVGGASGLPTINTQNSQGIYFIANYHSLTTPDLIPQLRQYSLQGAASWLALGLDVEKNILFRQTDVPAVCELAWILSCFASFGTLRRATTFKDRTAKGEDINVGLFNYPVLMAADILLYDTDFVPVGSDQVQHLEMTREFAQRFNHHLNSEVLRLPTAVVTQNVNVLPGTDGRKMSKSYNNTITPFVADKELKSAVMKIVTNSQSMEEPKNPDECPIFAIYSRIAQASDIAKLRERYLAGGMGWGHAKIELYEKILEVYAEPRKKFSELMANPVELENLLQIGAKKANARAQVVLERIRGAIKF